MSSPTPRKSLEPYLRDDVEYYEHQITGIKRMARMRSFILGDDMGLGKSLQALTVFCIDVKMGVSQTLLVVCPISLRDNWVDEIQKFTRLPFTLLGEVDNPLRPGRRKKLTPQERNTQLLEFMGQSGPRVLIANYEQVASATHASTFVRFNFDMIVFDEAHNIKNHKSKRTKASLALRSTRSAMLTGTPVLNQVDELWPLLHRIDPGRYPNPYSFQARFCVMGGYKNKQVMGTKNSGELVRALSEVMIRRIKRDVLNLPEPYYVQVKVGLTDYQQKLYDEASEDLRIGTVDIGNAGVLFVKLKQICSTPYALGEEFADDSAKLDRMTEIVQEAVTPKNGPGEKVVIFTQFRGALEAAVRRISAAIPGLPVFQLHGDIPGHERPAIVKQWSAVQGPAVIVCMLQVAGVGLNMTAASTGIFIDKLFVPGLNKQAVDRLHRIGASTTQAVQIFELIARGTCEDRIEKILKAKSKLFGDIVEGSVGLRKLMQELIDEERNAA